MRRVLIVAVVLAIGAGMMSTSRAADTAAARPEIRVQGDRLVDDLGRTVLLRGVNVVDKSPTHWFTNNGFLAGVISDDDLAFLAGLGFNSIRLGFTWAAIQPSPPSSSGAVYVENVVAGIRHVMDLAWAHGLRVVLDMHQDLFSEKYDGDGAPLWATPQHGAPPDCPGVGFPQRYFCGEPMAAFQNFWTNAGYDDPNPLTGPDPYGTGPLLDRFVGAWVELASALSDHPALLGYDLFNEPFPDNLPLVFETQSLARFYARVIPAVRRVDPTHAIFVEPPISKSVGMPSTPLRPDDPFVVYAPHDYSETGYFGSAGLPVSTLATSDLALLADDKAEAAAMKAPLWIGEWGFEGSPLGAQFVRRHYDDQDRLGVSSAFWTMTQGASSCEANRLTRCAAPDLVDAFVRVWPERIPAASWTFSYDPDSRGGSLTVPADTQGQAVVVAPARLYPAGARVTVSRGSAVWDAATGRISWDIGAGDGPATLRVDPAG